MSHEFRLADIGEGLEEAEIIRWLVTVGDVVTRDQPLIEVMTDKSNAELPAPISGTIVALNGEVGEMILVGGLIATIDDGSAVQPGQVEPSPPLSPPSPVPVTAPDGAAQTASAATGTPPVTAKPKASPSTRRLAAERGIDLTTITGSGPGGRIVETDLDQQAQVGDPVHQQAANVAVTSPEPAIHSAHRLASPVTATSAAPGVSPLRGVRRAVARSMAQSWSEIPHIHAFDHIDAEPMLEMRARLKQTDRPGYDTLTPLTFFVAAVARALRNNPTVNASINMVDETITQHAAINVGVAVASPQGLVVPVLHGADQLPFETLGPALAQLIRGAREGTLGREQFQGGTVTITNFGSLGGEQAVPIIRPPEAAIFGFGSIKDRPYVVDGQVTARKTLNVVVGTDHRLLDGDVTTAVLSDVAATLTDPLRLVI